MSENLSKKLKRALAMAALLVGASGVANIANKAQATEGWYGRIDAGYSVDGGLDNVDDDFDIDAKDADFNNDWMASGGLGYAFNHFRLEGEYSYRTNDISTDSFWDGNDVKAQALMLNLYYDFNKDGFFQPYVGVGVGGAKVDADAQSNGAFGGGFDDSDTVVAYQALVGAALRLSPRLDLDVGYRYFTAPDLEFDGDIDGVPTKFGADYTHQAVTVGLRWQFAAPAAPVAPTPEPTPTPTPVAVCPQSDFVVYFEWDRSALNPQALEVIDSAVARARECNVSAATIVGHTDTSGSTAYNVGLSERRASVVRDALVSRGLAASLISTEARGETDLARQTRDGVREPLNRRTAVTITFH